jgi:hypothetical protein
MVKNKRILESFEKKVIARTKVDIKKHYRIVNALYREAIALGVLPIKSKKLNIDHKIRLARILNHVSKTD